MARRYDSSTTTFSPEGRLHQVEYAIEAINNASTCVGILAKDGVVMACEKRVTSCLLAPAKTSEKIYKLCDHVACTVAGLTADANILIDQARLRAGRFRYQYVDNIPVEQLVEHVCNYKQAYTQYGGLRPFGVSFLFAGYDSHFGFQLYQSDPSGNYSGWKATVIGANNQVGKSLLKKEYGAVANGENNNDKEKINEDDIYMPDVKEAFHLAVKVLKKTMESTVVTPEKMECFSIMLDENEECVHTILSAKETQKVINDVVNDESMTGDL